MIKLMKYLKKSAGYVILIIALLFLQAYCDLSLPDYTSKIVNVGIQQSGIEDSVPEKIRKTSMDSLKLFMDENDKETVDSFYEEDGDNLVLKNDVTSEERDKLNDILAKPMMIAASFLSGSDEVTAMLSQMGVPEGTDPMQAITMMPKEALDAMTEKISEKIDSMQDSIITQAGVSYVKSEYEAMGEDVDAIQMHNIKMSGVKMLGMALITMLCAICVVFLSSRVAAALGHDLRNAVYRKVITFSSREYHKFSTASLITRCTNDIQQVQQVMAMLFRIVLYAPILGIGGVLRVLQTDSSMTWILGLAVGLILVVIIVLFQVAMPKFTVLQTLVDKLNLVTREILTGIPVIRAFSREKHEEERFEDANITLTKTNLFVNRCMTFMMPVMMLIMNAVSVLTIYSGSYAVDSGSMLVGDVMAFIQYAMQIIMSFLMITAMSIMLPRANVSARRINEVLETEVSVQDPEDPVQPSQDVKGTVEFDHVSFGYNPEKIIVHDFSAKVRDGQKIAIVGPTGAGKTTMVKLLMRFYDVNSGSIKVDGHDIREFKRSDLREMFGMVLQDTWLYNASIRDNIRYGKLDASEEEIQGAARAAYAHHFIETQPGGYDMEINEESNNISQGQKLLLTIARAILADPKNLILDEATSSVDTRTEERIQMAMDNLMQGRTSFVIAHRLSTIKDADVILVMNHGDIVEQGNHEELLAKGGFYADLYNSQFENA